MRPRAGPEPLRTKSNKSIHLDDGFRRVQIIREIDSAPNDLWECGGTAQRMPPLDSPVALRAIPEYWFFSVS
jgi:hypothetical protein